MKENSMNVKTSNNFFQISITLEFCKFLSFLVALE
jgi:hypothetical protein